MEQVEALLDEKQFCRFIETFQRSSISKSAEIRTQIEGKNYRVILMSEKGGLSEAFLSGPLQKGGWDLVFFVRSRNNNFVKGEKR